MLRRWAAGLAVTAAAAGALVLGAGLFTSSAHAIVGGQDAAEGEYPYVAHVTINKLFGCTGTLVAPTWVVTAGQCS